MESCVSINSGLFNGAKESMLAWLNMNFLPDAKSTRNFFSPSMVSVLPVKEAEDREVLPLIVNDTVNGSPIANFMYYSFVCFELKINVKKEMKISFWGVWCKY
tara:strand:- start:31 stop:339 length:309 start_codon:yes stop_codon:yes gene_type:complete